MFAVSLLPYSYSYFNDTVYDMYINILLNIKIPAGYSKNNLSEHILNN